MWDSEITHASDVPSEKEVDSLMLGQQINRNECAKIIESILPTVLTDLVIYYAFMQLEPYSPFWVSVWAADRECYAHFGQLPRVAQLLWRLVSWTQETSLFHLNAFIQKVNLLFPDDYLFAALQKDGVHFVAPENSEDIWALNFGHPCGRADLSLYMANDCFDSSKFFRITKKRNLLHLINRNELAEGDKSSMFVARNLQDIVRFLHYYHRAFVADFYAQVPLLDRVKQSVAKAQKAFLLEKSSICKQL